LNNDLRQHDRRMPVAFVAGPYRSVVGINGVWQNMAASREIAIALWRMGYVALVPNLNSGLFDGACPDEVWLDGAIELLRRSDLIVMSPGWQESSGANLEHTEAKRLGIPVFYWPDVPPAMDRGASEEAERASA
jgi:hypothetical protein